MSGQFSGSHPKDALLLVEGVLEAMKKQKNATVEVEFKSTHFNLTIRATAGQEVPK